MSLLVIVVASGLLVVIVGTTEVIYCTFSIANQLFRNGRVQALTT